MGKSKTEWQFKEPKKTRVELWRKKPDEDWKFYGGVTGGHRARDKFMRLADILIANDQGEKWKE